VRRLQPALAALLLIVVAGPARAAAPVALDGNAAASHPAVAVDQSGVAHFAWNERRPAGDVTHYCRIARGSASCAARRSLTAPGAAGEGAQDAAGPAVLLPDAETVIVVAHRCCRPRLVTWTSRDHGATFGPAAEAGSNPPSGQAALGPGGFAVSTITDGEPGGTFFQAAPLGGGPHTTPAPATATANVGDLGGGALAGSGGTLTFLDPLTPLTAFAGGGKVYFRRFTGGLDFNSLASWGPARVVDNGSAPRLATGPRGTFLAYRTPAGQVVARAWDGAGFGGQPVGVAEGVGASDLTADAGGRLHLLFAAGDGPGAPLRRAVSSDGDATWATEDLAPGVADATITELRGAAASDGGGFAVWHASTGGIRAARFGATGRLSPDCVARLRLGAGVAAAGDGCWLRSGAAYRTGGAVSLGGLRLARAGAQFTAVPSKRTLTTDRAVRPSLRGLRLSADLRVALRLPTRPGAVLAPGGAPIALSPPRGTGGTGVALGTLTPVVGAGGAVRLTVASARLGVGRLRTFTLAAGDSAKRLTASATLLGPGSRAALPLALTFDSGRLTAAVADGTFATPLRFAAGLRLAQADWRLALTRACGRIGLAGPATVSLGSDGRGGPVLSLDGDGALALSGAACRNAAALNVSGTGHLRDLPPGPLSLRGGALGGATFSGELISPPELSASVSADGRFAGGLDPRRNAWYATGGATGSLTGLGTISAGTLAMSSTGGRVCGSILSSDPAVPALPGGFHYAWGGPAVLDYPACGGDLGPFLDAKPGADGLTFSVPRGARSLTVRIEGASDAPAATLVQPGGKTVDTPVPPANGAKAAGVAAVRVPAQRRTFVVVTRPRAGTWSVRGPRVVAAARALAIAPVSLGGTVVAHGRRRDLLYRLSARPGQVVTVFERGGGASRSLGRLRSGGHTLSFVPARGGAGRRDLIAIVNSGGIPRAAVVVGKYTAPAPPRGT
jgi:hypothetical protein